MLDRNGNFIFVNKAYPHVGAKIRASWGSSGFFSLMQELRENRRDKVRQGFPAEVFFALDALASVHNDIFPQFNPVVKDIWSH
jgi:hypothetical protein